MTYVEPFYWIFLCLCWGLLVWQLFNHGEKGDFVQQFDPVPTLLALILIAGRWPTLFLNEQLNHDESGLIAGALAFLHDPVPWRGADLTTSGPLNAYVLLVPAMLGLGLNYFSARIVGLSLLIIAVICWYVAVKRVRGKFAALSVILPPVTFLCFVQNDEFIHCSTELLPIALLSIAALMATSLNKGASVRLFVAAVVLGMVPFAKLQAAPLAMVAFVSIFFFAWWIRGERFLKTVAVMGIGGLVAPLTIGATLLATATFDDASRSYILSGLDVSAVGQDRYQFVYYVLFQNWPFVFSIVVLGAITFAGANFRFLQRQLQGNGRWLIAASLVYAFASLFAIYKPRNPFGHYLLLGLPAAVFLATALIAPWGVGSAWQRAWARLRDVVRPIGAMASISFFVACAAFGFLLFYLKVPPLTLERASMHKPDAIGKLIVVLLKDDSHFAVWGWVPKYYVMAARRPTTRDVIYQFQMWDAPQKDYYRRRYLADFNRSRPNVFVDAGGSGNFSFKWNGLSPVEDFKELSEIVHRDYVLLLDIDKCGTPRTRIFVSKTRFSELDAQAKSISKTSICLQDDNDLSRLLSLLQ
jgi:hypothetical protein